MSRPLIDDDWGNQAYYDITAEDALAAISTDAVWDDPDAYDEDEYRDEDF